MKLREELVQWTASTFRTHPSIGKRSIVALIAGQHGFPFDRMARDAIPRSVMGAMRVKSFPSAIICIRLNNRTTRMAA